MLSHPVYVQKNVVSMLKKLSKTEPQQEISSKACINLQNILKFYIYKFSFGLSILPIETYLSVEGRR